MLAQAADGPLSSPDHAYELKWDGMRVLAAVDGAGWQCCSRNGLDATQRFPELSAISTAAGGRRLLLDGEVVTLVDGRPSFARLQPRMQQGNPEVSRRMAAGQPVTLVLFDILREDDEWLTGLPWADRRALLERLVRPSERIQLSPVWPDGQALWETVVRLDLEGVIAKRRAGHYRPGLRTSDWLKIKTVQTLEVVVGGWTEGSGERSGSLGALLVGIPEGRGLRYVGHVGTGFDRTALAQALEALMPLASPVPPFLPTPRTNAKPHWVRPHRVAEVRHQGWSGDGRLRAPVFVRWRPDRDSASLVEGLA